MDADTQALRDELDAALADLDNATSLSEINQTLVDMLEVLKGKGEHAAPQINVQVAPTPISNTVTVPPAPLYDIVFEHETDNLGRITRSRMIRTPAKKAA